ncbi:MAG: hypothetical protein WBD67_00220 [Terracidiphilus sp.]
MAAQIADGLLAIPAFVPVMVCPGYVAAWFTDLHGFRKRSVVERIFWSLPLSLAITPIASVLIGKAFSLNVVVALLAACTVVCAGVVWAEGRALRRAGEKWRIGFRPLGGVALAAALAWIAVVVLSLVDLEWGHKLYMNVAMLDECFRINWTESVLRTGVPPANPIYWFHHTATMRNYYFWYVLCAAVARMTHLPVRAVLMASSVWAGFSLAALSGLYLKYFLEVGSRLRPQSLRIVLLLAVSGLDICYILWEFIYLHIAPQGEIDLWSKNPIFSWLNNLLWTPHHVASLICCMFAFLIAWIFGRRGSDRITSIILVAMALASAFGLSVYVAFAFFLAAVAWGSWQVFIEHTTQPTLLLAVGGGGSLLFLLPYLWELIHDAGGIHGGSLFSFAIREMISPDGFAASSLIQYMSGGHQQLARNLAKLILLLPGYAIEFGFFLLALLIYVVPAYRDRRPLSPSQKSLVFWVVAMLPVISLIRSGVLVSNDFGWRAALIPQFFFLIAGSEVLLSWRMGANDHAALSECDGLPTHTPHWLRSIAAITLIIGMFTTMIEGLMLRFVAPIGDSELTQSSNLEVRNFFHKAYISHFGYEQLHKVIPINAVVQFNPKDSKPFWIASDLLNVDHQVAITSDKPWCGAELGGDPSGCAVMAPAIDSLYRGASASEARSVCRRFGIQYLVVRVYDDAWRDKAGWVWTLKPVVSDSEFRALDCE